MAQRWCILCGFLMLIFCVSGSRRRTSIVINTTKGKVRGYLEYSATGRPVYSFLGIPYGKPPIGNMRFKHPEPVDSWETVFNASVLPNSCWQIIDDMYPGFPGAEMWNPNTNRDEDCLYLNVWKPALISASRLTPLAVMVWIFGGGFYSGTSTLEVYDGKILASQENVIVVSMNYRVGALGFLAFQGRDDAKGNAGMFDQVLALEWVRDNIEYFGGDPKRVTLFGESAGAVSVSMHLLAPPSKHLFDRAIMQSGSANVNWGTMDMDVAKYRGLLLAEALRCPTNPNNMDAVMECLRGKDPEMIVYNEWVTMNICEFPFVPVVDGHFLVEPPLRSLERKTFKKTDILIGSNLEEGTYFIIYQMPELFPKQENVYVTRKQFKQSVKQLFNFSNSIGHDAITFQYTDWQDAEDSSRIINSFDKAVGDYYFVCNVNAFARAYSQAGLSVYYYYFVHRSSQNLWPKWMGVMHGDEINYVFGEPLNPKFNYTRAERTLSEKTMKYWSNFAITGTPNVDSGDNWMRDKWPTHTYRGMEYLTLSTDSLDIGRGPRIQECAFWENYLPQLISSTESISEVEHEWKDAFHKWRTEYIVDWKYEFDRFVESRNNMYGSCNKP